MSRLKNFIVHMALVFVGLMIAFAVAGHWYENGSFYWFLASCAVILGYTIVLWLAQLVWSRWKAREKEQG